MNLRSTLLAAAALTALLAGPIAATRADAPAPLAKGHAAAEPGACTAQHLAAVDEGYADARAMADRAIAFLEERPNDPHVARFFGATPRKVLVDHYRLIREALDQRAALDLRCEDRRVCGDGGTFAYVVFAHAQRPRPTMGFCGAYFAAERTGQDNRGGIVIHEVSHWVLNTRDAEYQPRGAQDLAKDEPHVAAMNADNYEYFAEFMPR